MARRLLVLVCLIIVIVIISIGCRHEQGEVESLVATEITSTSARLNGRVTSIQTDDINVRFLWIAHSEARWGEEDKFEWMKTDYQKMTSTGDFYAVIDDLQPNTLYRFVAVYGDTSFVLPIMSIPFTTLTENPVVTQVVETLNPSQITSILVTVNGELIDMGGASSVEVYFEWGESSGSYTHETQKLTMTAPGVFSGQILGNIMIGNTYYYRARAGATAHGSEKSFYVP
jgi:hypothetical protein